MESREKLSFSVSSVKRPKILPQEKVTEETKEFVTAIEDNGFISTKPKKQKMEYVIPMIKSKRSILASERYKKPNLGDNAKLTSDPLTQKAVEEIIADAQAHKDGFSQVDDSKESFTIPTGSTMTTSDADDPDDPEYSSVPLESFGMAMLLGMGMQQDKNVTKKDEKVIDPMEVKVRPKGLGLGADIASVNRLLNQAKNWEDERKEDLRWTAGACCQLTTGKHEGLYGVIQGMAEDDGRVVVKLTLSKSVITPLKHMVRLVDKDDYKKSSKYINKRQADEYKEKDDKRMAEERTKEQERHRQYALKMLPPVQIKGKQNKPHKSSSGSNGVSGSSRRKSSWLKPGLTVRIVDKHFQKGRYYKEKVRIIDVPTPNQCVCKTKNGKILDDVNEDILETVVPPENCRVMVVRGNYQWKEGEIVEKNSPDETAIVRLFQEEEITSFNYDDICEMTD